MRPYLEEPNVPAVQTQTHASLPASPSTHNTNILPGHWSNGMLLNSSKIAMIQPRFQKCLVSPIITYKKQAGNVKPRYFQFFSTFIFCQSGMGFFHCLALRFPKKRGNKSLFVLLVMTSHLEGERVYILEMDIAN